MHRIFMSRKKSEGMNDGREEGRQNKMQESNLGKFNNLSWNYLRNTFYDRKMSSTAVLPIKIIVNTGTGFENTLDDFMGKHRKVQL